MQLDCAVSLMPLLFENAEDDKDNRSGAGLAQAFDQSFSTTFSLIFLPLHKAFSSIIMWPVF